VFGFLMAGTKKALAAALLAAAALPSAASADHGLDSKLGRYLRQAGGGSGAYVKNLDDDRRVFSFRARTPRILASNTKLFTTSTALARFGVDGTLGTEVLGRGELDEEGVFRGDLFLRGGGDPTFGSRRFTRRSYGGGATVDSLAARLEQAGIQSVTGRVYGDESRFDSRRGGPDSGYRTSIWVGPLSALSFNRGLAPEGGRGFQSNPPLFAAGRLTASLKRRGVRVKGKPRRGRAPSGLQVLASVDSPPMSRLARLTNKPSDNFFAETLLKDLAMQARRKGTTSGGARVAMAFLRRLGVRARLADGSGLSRRNKASPENVVRLLAAVHERPEEYAALRASLPIAGRDGTLASRMRRGPARGRCRAKTGTISGVSALSGYCRARNGELYAFSVLNNGVNVYTARGVQDRVAQAIAGTRD